MRRLTLRIAGCIALALVLALVFLSPLGQRLERDFGLASLYYLRGPVEVPPEAIVIALDQQSVNWLQFNAGDFARVSDILPGCLTPHSVEALRRARNISDMPRGVHACLIGELMRRDARLIGFDILFQVETPDDTALAAAIRDAGNVVLYERIRTDAEQSAEAGALGLPQRMHPRRIFVEAAGATAAFLVNAPSGNFVEGYVRRMPEFPDLGNMAEVAWSLYTGLPEPAGAEPPHRPIWLYGPPRAIPTWTLRDVFERGSANPLPASLAAVAVFIGVSDPEFLGTKDHFKIPIRDARENDIGGVELLAAAFLNLLHGEVMSKPGPAVGASVVLLFVLAVTLAARILPGRWGLIAIAVLAGGYAAAAWTVFTRAHLWPPFAVPVFLGVTAAALLALATRYAFARMLVARLTPAPVARILLEASTTERRAVRTEPATVMFTDLVGSTRMGDRLSNLDYTAVMNHYYDAATTAIEAHEGMVVEFMGDGILAIWSESISGPHHATRACEAALALSAEMRAAPPATLPAAGEEIRLRIGINSGMTATGDIGARHRFNFKALGDTVNVAARLEQLGRDVDDGGGDVILVSHTTCAMSDFPPERFEDLGTVPLRGKRDPTGVARLRPEPDFLLQRKG